MIYTDEQLRAIETDGDLLVSASAGSGKTTVLLRRVLRLMKNGVPLRRMFITTFTNAAAADMRAKLGKLLLAEGMREEAEDLRNADISTLHTWCLKLARRYFFVTGDDPAFELATDHEANAWLREAAERALEEETERGDADDVLYSYTEKRRTDKIIVIVLNILRYAETRINREEIIRASGLWYGSEGVAAFLDGEQERCAAAYALQRDTVLRAAEYAKLGDKVYGPIEAMDAVARGEDARAVASGWGDVKPLYDVLKKLAEECGELAVLRAECRNDEAKEAAEVFSRIALRASELYERKKAEKTRLDFGDLERRAIAVLDSEYGDEVRGSYDCVFVDEYQDINEVQEGIIERLRRGATFFVGDVKQSIYAFRSCSPDAFIARMRNASTEKLLRLNINHRSKKGILALCNEVFSRIMTADFGGIDYARESMFVIDGDSADGSVDFVGYPARERTVRPLADWDIPYSVEKAANTAVTENISAEAEAVAAEVVALAAERPDYGDIAVIVRSRGGCIPELVRLLRKAGVPVSLDRGSVTDSLHLRRLTLFLRLIDNARDDIAMIGVMRSYFGKFTDAELVKIRALGGSRKPFFTCVREVAENSDVLGGKVRDFLAEVEKFTGLSGCFSVGELVGKITAYYDYFKYILGQQEGAAHAEALGEYLRAANSFGGTLKEWLDNAAVVSSDKTAAKSAAGVRIMTVHAAKGLEAKCVVLCNLAVKFNLTDVRDGCVDTFGLALQSRWQEERRRINSDVYLATRLLKVRSAKEEEMRILYVAMTRAEEKLIIVMPENHKASVSPVSAVCAADWLSPHVKNIRTHRVITAPPPAAARPLRSEVLAALEKAILPLNLPEAVYAKSTVTELSAAEELDTVQRTAVLVRDYDSEEAKQMGTAYHRALEQFDYLSSDILQSARLCDEVGGGTSARKLSAVADVLRPLAQGDLLCREQPFMLRVGDSVVQGVIDFMAIKGNDCIIVDYKLSYNPAKIAAYKKQLGIYSEAVSKLLGKKVTARYICDISSAELIKIEEIAE